MLNIGKAEVQKVMAVLDADHESIEAAAKACLEVMEQVYASRARYAVVGQAVRLPNGQAIPADDPDAIKISMGWYSTESNARVAAEQLYYNPKSKVEFRTWVLDVHHGTPASLHGEIRDKYKAAIEKRKQAAHDKLVRQIEKRNQEAQKRSEETKGEAA